METLKIEIKSLAVPVDRQLERRKTFKTLKKAFKEAVKIANDTSLDVTIRLQALRIVGYLAQCLAGLIKDFTAEEVEAQIERIKNQIQRMKEEKSNMVV